jgi:hypothetical protein
MNNKYATYIPGAFVGGFLFRLGWMLADFAVGKVF